MANASRRRFIEKLGLGAGAMLLAPIVGSILDEAHGATPAQPKRLILFLTSNGTAPYYFTPQGIDPGGDSDWSAQSTTDFAWPAMVQALEPYRKQMLLIDGLPNRITQSQHSCGFGALSMMPCARGLPAEYGGPPGGITIDQFIAQGLGAGTPVGSLLYGVSAHSKTVDANVFASGVEQPEPSFVSPALLYASLFKTIGSPAGAARQELMMNILRTDIKRLNASLAGPDKAKLEHYLQIVEDYDARQKSLPGLMCKAPAVVPTSDLDDAHVEDKLEAMTEMAVLALSCGMTRVVGVASGCGNGHQAPDFGRLGVGFEGHSPPEVQGPAQTKIHNFHASLLKRFADALSAVPEGNGTMLDNTVMVYLNDNGDGHHASHNRFPLVVLGNAGGALKADGRFLRYAPGQHSLADFFCSLGHAMGVPTDDFGKGGVEAVKGPLAEIMA